MGKRATKCPLTQQQLIDQYFIEARNKVLDVAAFLDRLDRASKIDGRLDFRLLALKKTLKILSSKEPQRIKKILMSLSDPNLKPLAKLDRKSAYGAHKSRRKP